MGGQGTHEGTGVPPGRTGTAGPGTEAPGTETCGTETCGTETSGTETPGAAPADAAGAAGASDVVRGPGDDVHGTLAALVDQVARLTGTVAEQHRRAGHREQVIDQQHAELERLRAGERRSLLRPMLVELARLRNDLVAQAGRLPADYDAPRASRLLLSYADTIEQSLLEGGVVAFRPAAGDPFDPRAHRRVGVAPAVAPHPAGTVAHVVRDGYLDLDLARALFPAEVVVHTAPAAPPAPHDQHAAPGDDAR